MSIPISSTDDSFLKNINLFEESQTHITSLLDKLDEEETNEGASNMKFLMNAMDSMIDHFSDSQHELVQEMNSILENSRHGLLTYDQLSNMITGEQLRTEFLMKMASSFHHQILSLQDYLTEKLNLDCDITGDELSDVVGNMNVLKKTAESLSRAVATPNSTVKSVMSKLDKELVLHLSYVNPLIIEKKDKDTASKRPINSVTQTQKKALEQKNPFNADAISRIQPKRIEEKFNLQSQSLTSTIQVELPVMPINTNLRGRLTKSSSRRALDLNTINLNSSPAFNGIENNEFNNNRPVALDDKSNQNNRQNSFSPKAAGRDLDRKTFTQDNDDEQSPIRHNKVSISHKPNDTSELENLMKSLKEKEEQLNQQKLLLESEIERRVSEELSKKLKNSTSKLNELQQEVSQGSVKKSKKSSKESKHLRPSFENKKQLKILQENAVESEATTGMAQSIQSADVPTKPRDIRTAGNNEGIKSVPETSTRIKSAPSSTTNKNDGVVRSDVHTNVQRDVHIIPKLNNQTNENFIANSSITTPAKNHVTIDGDIAFLTPSKVSTTLQTKNNIYHGISTDTLETNTIEGLNNSRSIAVSAVDQQDSIEIPVIAARSPTPHSPTPLSNTTGKIHLKLHESLVKEELLLSSSRSIMSKNTEIAKQIYKNLKHYPTEKSGLIKILAPGSRTSDKATSTEDLLVESGYNGHNMDYRISMDGNNADDPDRMEVQLITRESTQVHMKQEEIIALGNQLNLLEKAQKNLLSDNKSFVKSVQKLAIEDLDGLKEMEEYFKSLGQMLHTVDHAHKEEDLYRELDTFTQNISELKGSDLSVVFDDIDGLLSKFGPLSEQGLAEVFSESDAGKIIRTIDTLIDSTEKLMDYEDYFLSLYQNTSQNNSVENLQQFYNDLDNATANQDYQQTPTLSIKSDLTPDKVNERHRACRDIIRKIGALRQIREKFSDYRKLMQQIEQVKVELERAKSDQLILLSHSNDSIPSSVLEYKSNYDGMSEFGGYNPTQTIPITTDDISQPNEEVIELQNKQKYELPIVAIHGGIMTTRTYREIPPNRTFLESLIESDNPLCVLYYEYSKYLPMIFKTRLLTAAVIEDRIQLQLNEQKISNFPSPYSLPKVFENLLTNISIIEEKCVQILQNVGNSESIVANLISIKVNPMFVDIDAMGDQITGLYTNFGEIEALKMEIELHLQEYRTIYERINAISLHELNNIMKESNDFKICYQKFCLCQGKSVEAHQRLIACKDRCIRYKLTPKDLYFQITYNKSQSQSRQDQNDMRSVSTTVHQTHNHNNHNIGNEQHLIRIIENLQKELSVSDNEIKELEEELFDSMQEQSFAPAALLFFALMHDPTIIPTLQQLVIQLSHLKPFVNSTAHLDYLALKKRMQVCVVCIPSIEKLLSKYKKLYDKWTINRVNWFSQRNLTGGAADAYTGCPMCFKNLLILPEHEIKSFHSNKNNDDKIMNSPNINNNNINVTNNRQKYRQQKKKTDFNNNNHDNNIKLSQSLPQLH
eukprot:gene9642-12981_t